MAIASKGDRRKGDIEKIKIEEEGSKDQELTVRHEAVLPKKSELSVELAGKICSRMERDFYNKEKEKKSRKMRRKQERNDS